MSGHIAQKQPGDGPGSSSRCSYLAQEVRWGVRSRRLCSHWNVHMVLSSIACTYWLGAHAEVHMAGSNSRRQRLRSRVTVGFAVQQHYETSV